MGGQPRNRLAALDVATGAVLPWAPNPDNVVRTIAVDGGTVYVGASSARSGAVPRGHRRRRCIVRRGDVVGSARQRRHRRRAQGFGWWGVRGWILHGDRRCRAHGSGKRSIRRPASRRASMRQLGPFSEIRALTVTGSTIYAGGYCHTAEEGSRGTIWRPSDASTGAFEGVGSQSGRRDQFPGFQHGIQCLRGGIFRHIAGAARLAFAILDASSGAADVVANGCLYRPWRRIGRSCGARDLEQHALCGRSVQHDRHEIAEPHRRDRRERPASCCLGTRTATRWSTRSSSTGRWCTWAAATLTSADRTGSRWRRSIETRGSRPRGTPTWAAAWSSCRPWRVAARTIYVAGNFATVGGLSHVNLAAVDETSGLPTAWTPPAPNNEVDDLVVDPTGIYVGGFFTALGERLATAWRRSTRPPARCAPAGARIPASRVASWRLGAGSIMEELLPAR